QAEIQQLLADFRSWLLNHFEFTAEQVRYVEQLAPDYLFALAQQVALAITTQSSIDLKQEPKESDDGGKVIETERISKTAFTKAEGYQSIAHLSVHIRYTQ